MRLYTFTNFYLSSIQQGIQPAHLIADMFVKYAPSVSQEADPPDEWNTLREWAVNHKTMICLNGGNAAGIRQLQSELRGISEALHLPVGHFCEDEQSLDNTMTCVGIVVPEHIYEAAAFLRANSGGVSDIVSVLTPNNEGGYVKNVDELQLAQLLNSYGLAK